jgi:uncharacterized membrane protein
MRFEKATEAGATPAERGARERVPQDRGRQAEAPAERIAPGVRGNGHEPATEPEGRSLVTSGETREQANMDVLVGYVLAGGVITSMILVATGLIWHWAITGSLGLDYSMGGMNFFRFVVSDVVTVIRTGFGPRRMINLGVAVLMLTPFIRVASSMFYFAVVEHNWKYTIFTGFVLTVLTYSLFLR